MVSQQRALNKQRDRRRFRVRKSFHGTAERPRLTVFRSSKHIYCQLIDDDARRTLVSASTRDTDLRGSLPKSGNKEAAAEVGKAVAQKAIQAGVKAVCFDRGDYKYHGRVQALADAAREAGLAF